MKKKLFKKNTQKSYFASSGVHAPVQIENGRFFMKLNKSRQDEFNVWDLKAGWYKNGTQKRRRPYRRKRDFPLKRPGFSQDTIPEISTTRASGSFLLASKIWTLANFLQSPKLNFISIVYTGIDANSSSSKFTPLSSPRLLLILLGRRLIEV